MQRRRWLLILMVAGLFMVSGALVSAQDSTPEATESAPLELSQHYVTDDERVAFSYPEGWVLELRSPGDGYYVEGRLGISQAVMDADLGTFGDGLDSGEVYMEIAIAEVTKLAGDLLGLTAESSPAEILQKAFDVNGVSDITFGKVVSLEVDGQPAARLDGHTNKGSDGFVLIVALGDGVIGGVSVGAPEGELPQWEPTVMAIAESMTFAGEPAVTPEFTPESTPGAVLELTQTMSVLNDALIIKYPENWAIYEASNTEVDIASAQNLLTHDFGDGFSPGQVKIMIQMYWTQDLASALKIEADASAEKIVQAAVKLTAGDEGIEFTTVTSMTIKDRPAGFTHFTSIGFDGLMFAIDYEQGITMFIQVLAAPGEAEQWKDLTVAIAEAAKYPG